MPADSQFDKAHLSETLKQIDERLEALSAAQKNAPQAPPVELTSEDIVYLKAVVKIARTWEAGKHLGKMLFTAATLVAGLIISWGTINDALHKWLGK